MSAKGKAAALSGVVLTVALVAYAGPADLAQRVGRASTPLVLLAALSTTAFFVLRGLRWRILLRTGAPDVPLRLTAAASATGWLVSSYVPFKAGEAVRVAIVGRRRGLAAVAGSILPERAFDIIGGAVYATAGLALLAVHDGSALPTELSFLLGLAWLVPIVGLGALLLLARAARAGHLPRGRLRAPIQSLLSASALLATSRRTILPVAALTLLITGAQAATVALLTLAVLPGAPVLAVAAAAPLFLLSFAIAVTPGHVGTYEAAYVAIFTLAGVAGTGLLDVAIAVHILGTGIVTIVGIAAIPFLARTKPQAHTPPPQPEAIGP